MKGILELSIAAAYLTSAAILVAYHRNELRALYRELRAEYDARHPKGRMYDDIRQAMKDAG